MMACISYMYKNTIGHQFLSLGNNNTGDTDDLRHKCVP